MCTRSRFRGGRLLAVLLVALAGCYPGGPENVDDTGLVITSRVPGTEYAGIATFAMENEVRDLETGDDTAQPIDVAVKAAILEELRAQMVAAGFSDISGDADPRPDVWLVVGAVQSEVWYYYYNWGYWGGWYPPGWGYYPPSVGLTKFDQGTVLWILMDMRGRDPDAPTGSVPGIWYAGLNGLLASKSSQDAERARKGIRQAFTQSTYIQASPAAK